MARYLWIEALEPRVMLSAPTLFPLEAPPEDWQTSTLLMAPTAAPFPLDQTFLLHSNPNATKTIYLDFDGHTTTGTEWNTWSGINSIVTPPYSFEGDSSFSNAELEQIQRIWERVAEDFLPFDVNVTTQDPGAAALRKSGPGDTQWGIRVVIGPDQMNTGAGGIAFLDSFTWNTDTPVFVFNTSEIGVAEAISHEVGHSLGLEHDGAPGTEYYQGHGSGATGWAPIMGVGYYKELVQWSKGEYPGANEQEDDLHIITTRNGFGYRADDHGNSIAAATALGVTSGTIVFSEGIIERNTDLDFFVFTTGAGVIDLAINPFYRSPNLDILATLYDVSGNVVAISNPVNLLSASFNLNLAAGIYYLSIEGTGKTAVAGHPGYSDYGSLGYYSISGTIIAASPAPEIEVRGNNVIINDGDDTPSASDGTSFGTVTQGAPAVERTFTVTNLGSATLTLGAPTLPAGFNLTEPLAASLEPGQSDSFTVSLPTATIGTFSGQISFTNNDSDENPFNFSITGTVTTPVLAPEIEVRGNNIIIADGDNTPSEVDGTNFGSAVQGAAAPQRTFTVTNIGTATLTLGTPSLPAGYSLVEPLASSLAPGVSDSFTVSLSTASVGTFNGQISFTNNDSDENPFNFSITGTVTAPVPAPVIEVRGNNIVIADGDITPSPTDGTNFGNLTQGGAAVQRTFTVRNIGTASLTLGIPSLPAGYSLTEPLSASLAPGASDTFTVSLSTAAVGTFFGQISFTTNDAPRNPFNFAITGVVAPAPPAISATPGTPDLTSGSDTGISNTDNLTNLNNSSMAKRLTFLVPGVVSGATVQLFAGGTLIGSAVASGNAVSITTNGTVNLADGTYPVTAKQTEPGKLESATSAALSVTIDTTAPSVAINQAAGQEDPTTALPVTFTAQFSESVFGFSASDVVIGGSAGGAPTVVIAGSGTTYTVSVSGFTSNGIVVATIPAGAVIDAAGNSSAASTSTDNVVQYNLPVGTVTGMLWRDLDGDGLRDPAEPELSGWTVQVIDPVSGQVIATTLSGNDGVYSAGNLEPGLYRVRTSAPSGWIQTSVNPADTTVIGGLTVAGGDFGNFELISISGVKFEDDNGNGQLDAGESGLAGWTIELVDAQGGQLIATTHTSADGSYGFTDLGPGAYRVREAAQPGWLQTTPEPNDIIAVSGHDVVALNFGNFKLVTFSGVTYEDDNGNGQLNAAESGLEGWTIELIDALNAQVLATTATASDGSYSFTNLGPGIYRIREPEQAGWLQTTTDPDDIIAASGHDMAALNFGNFKLATLGGVKYEDDNGNGQFDADESGLEGWTIELIDALNAQVLATTATASDGSYSFTDLGPGTYRIREVAQPQWVQTSQNPADIVLTSGTDLGALNFGNFMLITLGGVKYEDHDGNGHLDAGEAGLEGWTIELIDAHSNELIATTLTNSEGGYSFADLGPGAYRVRESARTGWMQSSDNPTDINVTSGTDVNGVNFGNFQLVTLAGAVYEDYRGDSAKDADDPPLAGRTVQLIDPADGAVIASTTTTAEGVFEFVGIGPGTYRIRKAPEPGWTQTTDDPADIIVHSGEDITGVLFGTFHNVTLSGVTFEDHNGNGQFDPGETGLEYWTIELIDAQSSQLIATTMTAADGSYSFTDLGPGAYRVRETPRAGWIQTINDPADAAVTSGNDISHLNFGNFKLVTLSGVKYEDDNGNGQLDPGEGGLGGWIIELIDALNGELITTTVTADDGSYYFADLAAGAYRVREIAQEGWLQTSNDPADTTATSGDDRNALNFGNFQLVTLSGITYDDLNGDGIFNDGEVGLANRVIYLDANDNGILDAEEISVISDISGVFAFPLLGPGAYRIRQVLPPGWSPSTAPTDITVASGTHITDILLGSDTLIPLPDLVGSVTLGPEPVLLLPGEKFNVAVTITNRGDAPAAELGDVQVFASFDKTLDEDDLLVGTLASRNVSLDPQASSVQTLTVTIPPNVDAGKYFLIAWVDRSDALVERHEDNNSAVTDDSLEVALLFGNIPGRKNFKLTRLIGDSVVTFTLRGNGQGELVFDETAGAYNLLVTGSDQKTKVAVTVKGGSGRAILKDIVAGDLRSLAAKTIDILGNVTLGAITTVALGHLGGAHVIEIGANAAATSSAVKITLGNVADTILISGLAIKSLTLAQWLDGDGAGDDRIEAPQIGSLISKGPFQAGLNLSGELSPKLTLGKARIAGPLGASANGIPPIAVGWNITGHIGVVTVAGDVDHFQIESLTMRSLTIKGDLGRAVMRLRQEPDVKLKALGKLTVVGQMDDVLLETPGNVGTIRAGRMSDSRIFAGVDGEPTPEQLAAGTITFLPGGASIAGVTLTGIKDEAIGAANYLNSIIAAFTLGKMTLKMVDTTAAVPGLPLGLAANSYRATPAAWDENGAKLIIPPNEDFISNDFHVKRIA